MPGGKMFGLGKKRMPVKPKIQLHLHLYPGHGTHGFIGINYDLDSDLL